MSAANAIVGEFEEETEGDWDMGPGTPEDIEENWDVVDGSEAPPNPNLGKPSGGIDANKRQTVERMMTRHSQSVKGNLRKVAKAATLLQSWAKAAIKGSNKYWR